MDYKKTMLFAMPNVEDLGQKVSKDLGLKLSTIKTTIFADGEAILQAEETVRNKHVFVIASLCTPVNDNIMQLLLFVDSLKRASALSITVVTSYFGYARQDRKAEGRQPIGAKVVAKILETAGVTKVIATDLHNPSIQGFFDIPLDDLRASYVLAEKLVQHGEKFTIASPDHGGAVRARVLAELISDSMSIAIVDKRRTGPNKSETMGILGSVDGKNVVIIDDMIDTGGTIIKAAKAIKEAGAKKIVIAASHGLFSRGFDIFDEAEHVDKVLVTDSVPRVHSIKSKKLEVVSISEIIAKTLKATADSESISIIYKELREKLKPSN